MARDRELILGLQRADVATPTRSQWQWKLHRLEPVLVSAALAVSLHAVVFSVPVRGRQASSDPTEHSVSRTLRVRTLSAWGAGSSNANEGSSADPQLAAISTADSRLSMQDSESTSRDPRMETDAGGRGVSPPADGLVLRIPGALGDADFFPRDALDLGPSPTMPVLIDYPSIRGVAGTHVGLLSLFIDETGKVVRVRVDTQTLPPEMQEAARTAFMGAAFTPGLVDGLPVRSRIRVEVIFETGTLSR